MKRRRNVMYTKKNRVVSFTDAVLSILMTLLVLGLKQPASPDPLSFWALRESFFSYALSFFWIGSLWATFNNIFEMVEKVDNQVILSTLIMLFLCSFIPYATTVGSEYFYSRLVQMMFGGLFIASNLSTYWMYNTLIRANPGDTELQTYLQLIKKTLRFSILIKVIGMLLSALVYPPIMMYSIILAAVFSVLYRNHMDHRIAPKIQND